jgi:aryl-alcohol dehydrogenase-like predicted oxidoreductase
MEQRRLGSSGLRVSVIALGGNSFGGRMDLEKTRAVVQRALDLGVTLIDTADSYPQGVGEASETFIGDILGARRKEIVLSTKFGSRVGTDPTRKGASRQYLMQAVEGSLRRLRTDWIDLYQLHRPDR